MSALGGQQHGQPGAHDGLVVGHDDPDRHGATAVDCSRPADAPELAQDRSADNRKPPATGPASKRPSSNERTWRHDCLTACPTYGGSPVTN
jgi:hypothetical protein